MNDLQVIQNNGVEVVDSRAVAEMIGKNHKELLRDIRNYAEIIENSIERNFALNDFFIESSYKDSIGRTLPCYLITKKGCDMVANKMTGEKGVLFTAAYVTAFEKMHEALKPQQPQFSALSPQLQALISIEMRQQEAERRMDALEAKTETAQKTMHSAISALSMPTVSRDHWQDATRSKIRQLCMEFSLNFQTETGSLYRKLEETASCNLDVRLKHLRERMRAGGAKYSECQAANKLTVVAQDQRLREIFSGIVQRRSAQLMASKLPT